MSGQSYRLPNFLVLLPKKPGGRISPHFLEADNGYHSWVYRNIGWLFAIQVYDSEIPLLAALTYPLASCKALRGIMDYMTASQMLEDWCDHCSSEKAVSRTQLWIKTLRQDDKLKEKSTNAFIRTMRRDLVPNIRAAVDPFHWRQFMDSNEHYAKSTIQEALDREAHPNKNVVRKIQSYMVMRRESIGTRPCFVLLRSIRRLYIPDDALANPIIREMENVALDMIFIPNDVYSFKKEWDDNGALNNILTVMQKDPVTKHLDLQQRLDYTGELFKVALNQFQDCRKRLPSFDEELDRHIASYADGLIDWVIGNIEWSIVNRRYRVFADEPDRKNNVMRMYSNNLPRKLLRFVAWLMSFIFFYLYYLRSATAFSPYY